MSPDTWLERLVRRLRFDPAAPLPAVLRERRVTPAEVETLAEALPRELAPAVADAIKSVLIINQSGQGGGAMEGARMNVTVNLVVNVRLK